MTLKQRSGLTVASLRTILKVTGGVTSRVFIMNKSLAIEAIETGEEWITDEAVQQTSHEIAVMTLPDTMHHSARYVSRDEFQYCSVCVAKAPDLVLRHWRFAW